MVKRMRNAAERPPEVSTFGESAAVKMPVAFRLDSNRVTAEIAGSPEARPSRAKIVAAVERDARERDALRDARGSTMASCVKNAPARASRRRQLERGEHVGVRLGGFHHLGARVEAVLADGVRPR